MTNAADSFVPSFSPPVGGTPLREFKGTLADYKAERRSGEKNGKTWTIMPIKFNFADIEVIETTEPYPWPTATIEVLYNDPNTSYSKVDDSEWAHLATSIRKIVGKPPDIQELKTRRFHMKILPATLRQKNEAGDYVPTESECWQVVGIEGIAKVEAADLYKVLAEVADNKNEQQFYSEALQKEEIRGNPTIVEQITGRQLINVMLATGHITQTTDGLLHKAEVAVAS